MTKSGNQFEQQAEQSRSGLIREFIDFLKDNKKWWLAPIIIVFLLLGLLVVLSGSGLGPYVYTFF